MYKPNISNTYTRTHITKTNKMFIEQRIDSLKQNIDDLEEDFKTSPEEECDVEDLEEEASGIFSELEYEQERHEYCVERIKSLTKKVSEYRKEQKKRKRKDSASISVQRNSGSAKVRNTFGSSPGRSSGIHRQENSGGEVTVTCEQIETQENSGDSVTVNTNL